MTLINSINNSVSGMIVHTRALGIISNNLSNSNTYGYKTESSIFNTIAVDLGIIKRSKVIMAFHDSQRNHDKQGGIKNTGMINDLAVIGKGFITLIDTKNNKELYTRDGRMEINPGGYFIHKASQMPVLGAKIPVGKSVDSVTVNKLESILIDTKAYIAKQTEEVKISGNLPASQRNGNISSMRTFLFDREGMSDPVDLLFSKVDNNLWKVSYDDSEAKKLRIVDYNGQAQKIALNKNYFEFFTINDKKTEPMGFTEAIGKKVTPKKSTLKLIFDSGGKSQVFEHDFIIKNMLSDESYLHYNNVLRLNKSGGYSTILQNDKLMTLMPIELSNKEKISKHINVTTSGLNPMRYLGHEKFHVEQNASKILFNFDAQQYAMHINPSKKITANISLNDASHDINGKIYTSSIRNTGIDKYDILMNVKNDWENQKFIGKFSPKSNKLVLEDVSKNKKIVLNMHDILSTQNIDISRSFSDLSNNFVLKNNIAFGMQNGRVTDVQYANNKISIAITNNDTLGSTIFSGDFVEGQNYIKIGNTDFPEQFLVLNLDNNIANSIFSANATDDIPMVLKNYLIGRINIKNVNGTYSLQSKSPLVISGLAHIEDGSGTVTDVSHNPQKNTIDISYVSNGSQNIYSAKLQPNGRIYDNSLSFDYGASNLSIAVKHGESYNTNNPDDIQLLTDRLKYALQDLKVQKYQIQNSAEKALNMIMDNVFNGSIAMENGHIIGNILDNQGNIINNNNPITLVGVNDASKITLANLDAKYHYSNQDISDIVAKIHQSLNNTVISNEKISELKATPNGNLPELNGKAYNISTEYINNNKANIKLVVRNKNNFQTYHGIIDMNKIIKNYTANIENIISLSNGQDVLKIDISNIDPLLQDRGITMPSPMISNVEWTRMAKNDAFISAREVGSDDINYKNIELNTKKGSKFTARIALPMTNEDPGMMNRNKAITFSNGSQSFSVLHKSSKPYIIQNPRGMNDFLEDLNQYIQGIGIENWEVKDSKNNKHFSIIEQKGMNIDHQTFQEIFTTNDTFHLVSDDLHFRGTMQNNTLLLEDGNNKIKFAFNQSLDSDGVITAIKGSLGMDKNHYPLGIDDAGNIIGKDQNILVDMMRNAFGVKQNDNASNNILARPKNVIIEPVEQNVFKGSIFVEDVAGNNIKYSGLIDLNNKAKEYNFYDNSGNRAPLAIDLISILNNSKNNLDIANANISAKINFTQPNQRFISSSYNDFDNTITIETNHNARFSMSLPQGIINNDTALTFKNNDQEFTLINNGMNYDMNVADQKQAFIRNIREFVAQGLVWNNNTIASIQQIRFDVDNQKNINITQGKLSNAQINGNIFSIDLNDMQLSGLYNPGDRKLTLKNGNIAMDISIENANMNASDILQSINNAAQNTNIQNNKINKNQLSAISHAIMKNTIIKLNNAEDNNGVQFATGSTINTVRNHITPNDEIKFDNNFYLQSNQVLEFDTVDNIHQIQSNIKEAFNGRIIKNNKLLQDIALIQYNDSGHIKDIMNSDNQKLSQAFKDGFEINMQNFKDASQQYTSKIKFKITDHEKGFGDLTQMDGLYKIDNIMQDGIGYGEYRQHYFDNKGILYYKYSNGYERPVYKLPISTFINPANLDKISGNIFQGTEKAGQVVKYWAGQGNAGSLQVNSLEMSNVDITENMVDMIKYQQAFTAAAKILSTSDSMTKTILDIKR